jgi:hypothetical protein
MENLEVCNFVLNSNDIYNNDTYTNYPYTSATGDINDIRNIITFKGVNIQNILGDMYDKYDKFNLRLTGVNASLTTYGTASIDRLHVIHMKGLPWVNCSYNTSLKCNTDTCILGSFNGTSASAYNVNFESSCIATFDKCQNTNITITLLKIDGTTPSLSANTMLPRFQFFFSVTGVK